MQRWLFHYSRCGQKHHFVANANGLFDVPHTYYYSRRMLRVFIIVLSIHCLVN